MYVRMYICMYAYMYVCMYVFNPYSCICGFMYVHICTIHWHTFSTIIILHQVNLYKTESRQPHDTGLTQGHSLWKERQTTREHISSLRGLTSRNAKTNSRLQYAPMVNAQNLALAFFGAQPPTKRKSIKYTNA